MTCSEQVAGEEGKQLMTGDMNACIEGCFAAGATEVVIRDHHGGGRNVDPQAIDKRAKLIQGETPGSRFKDIEGSAAIILLGYHAMALTPGGTLAHSYSSASIQGMWLNGREVGEIGVDAAIAAEHNVPVVMVSGDDKCCAEAQVMASRCGYLPDQGGNGAAKCRCAAAGRIPPPDHAEDQGSPCQAKRDPPHEDRLSRYDSLGLLAKGSLRTHNPEFKPVDNPRRVEKTGDSVEALLIGK